ncbi:hypothetical protein ACHAPU_010876 [Fusarium lateritium]
MPRKRTNEGPLWSMHPDLHDEVADKLEEVQLEYSFNTNDDDLSKVELYNTNIMGKFACNNGKCKKNGWSSKQIAITIREYSRDRYNARVYHQRCKQCKSLGQLSINQESYIDRVSYRIKKWNGVEMERPVYSGTSNGPHEAALCEGCKNGQCSGGNRDQIELA